MLLAACSCAFALNPALDVSQYAHTSWKIRDGFTKGSIGAIAQTPDGYLWLGTEFGLVRFDGVRAVAWQPPAGQSLPSNYIGKLLAAREAKVNGKFVRSFEVLNMETLNVEKHADRPDSLSLFYRWQDPAWKRQTVSLR